MPTSMGSRAKLGDTIETTRIPSSGTHGVWRRPHGQNGTEEENDGREQEVESFRITLW